MVRPRLDVHCCRSRLAIADGWHLLHRQYMRPGWQPSAIGATLYDVRDGPAIDLEIESEIPSEVRYPVHSQVTRRNMTRPEVTRRRTALRNNAENCAYKTKNQKNLAGDVVFRFHDTDHTRGSGFSPAAGARNFHDSLKSPVCSCVSITLPAASYTRITASCDRLLCTA